MKFEKNGQIHSDSKLIDTISGNVKSPSGELVMVEFFVFELPTVEGEVLSWGVTMNGNGRVQSMTFTDKAKMQSVLDSQSKMFV